MHKTHIKIFFGVFSLFLLLVPFLLGFYFFYNVPLFSQALYWEGSAYNIGIYSVKVENGKTYISLKISENFSTQTFLYKDDIIPPIEMYLMAYGHHYFGREYTVERDRITCEFDSTGIPDIIFVYIAGQYNKFITHLSFDGRTKKPVRFYITPENAVDLQTHLNQGKLRINASGNSPEYASITFENISGTTLSIRSGIGTWLKNYDKNFQNMALTTDCAFVAESGKIYTLILPAVCLNKSLKFPENTNVFTVEHFDASEPLISILKELSLSSLAPSEIQNRIWVAIESDINANRGSAWR